jgi:hypothetical protein
MKKIIAIVMCIVLLTIMITSVTVFANDGKEAIDLNEINAFSYPTAPSSLENLLVTIKGLKVNDVATITLLPETATEDSVPIKQISITGKGTEVRLDLSGSLKDGYYRLNISAPDEYFREPKTWFFMVANSQLVNPQGKSAIFSLIPPELQTYKPYRESSADTIVGSMPKPPSQPPSTMVESMRSLSDSPKQPIGSAIDSTGYHHFHWESSLASPGIWSRFTVTNPGVRHGATGEFVNDHIYVLKYGTNMTLEVGWIEGNWLSDTRYGFYYDPVNGYGYFDLSGSPLEVAIQYMDPYWYAMKITGGTWFTVHYANLGYSQYDLALNGGEVYTDYATHPSFPAAYTDLAKLYLNGWTTWNWQRWATTQLINDADAYSLHTTTNYYNFYVHSD